MKNKMICLLAFFGLISCNDRNNDYHVVVPGKGFDNMIISKTTLNEIYRAYGKDCKVDTHYICLSTSSTFPPKDSNQHRMIFSISYTYESLGLSFFFKQNEKAIFAINCKSPFKAKTENNLFLDSSKFGDVIKYYGNTYWSFSGDKIKKDYKGISFSHKYFGSIPPTVSDSSLSNYLNGKITEIDIIEIKK